MLNCVRTWVVFFIWILYLYNKHWSSTKLEEASCSVVFFPKTIGPDPALDPLF